VVEYPTHNSRERPQEIQDMMLNVTFSDKENWKMSGIDGAGFGPVGTSGVFLRFRVLRSSCLRGLGLFSLINVIWLR